MILKLCSPFLIRTLLNLEGMFSLSRFFTLNNLFSAEIYSEYMTSAAMANRGSERASERREQKESESCFRGLVMQAKCSWWAGSFRFPGNHLWSLFFHFMICRIKIKSTHLQEDSCSQMEVILYKMAKEIP